MLFTNIILKQVIAIFACNSGIRNLCDNENISLHTKTIYFKIFAAINRVSGEQRGGQLPGLLEASIRYINRGSLFR